MLMLKGTSSAPMDGEPSHQHHPFEEHFEPIQDVDPLFQPDMPRGAGFSAQTSLLHTPSLDYGRPNAQWPLKNFTYNQAKRAFNIYLYYADPSDAERDIKYNARCNREVALALLSGDEDLIRPAVKWLQKDNFRWPKDMRRIVEIAGEAHLWDIILLVSHYFDWRPKATMKWLSALLDQRMVSAFTSGSEQQQSEELKRLQDLVYEKQYLPDV